VIGEADRRSGELAPWWQEFFKEGAFRPLFDIYPRRSTGAEVRFILKALKLRKGDSLLDICCGIGRHLIPLAKRGIKVTGVDLCPEYLEEAEKRAKRAKVKINLLNRDARKIRLDNRFSGAINMWTSIGYFEKEAENFSVIKNAYRALRPGGAFLVHTLNRDWIARNFAKRAWCWVGEGKAMEEREVDFATARLNSTWTFVRNGKEVQKRLSLRMYCFHELREYFRRAGFEEVTAYGGIDFSPLAFDSRMLFIVGKKPR
jgi:ubiquinone/menaquinone biosynthesis C-methylase UbiE